MWGYGCKDRARPGQRDPPKGAWGSPTAWPPPYHAERQLLVQRVVGQVMERDGRGQTRAMGRGRVGEAPDGVLLPPQLHVIVYPLQRLGREQCTVTGLPAGRCWIPIPPAPLPGPDSRQQIKPLDPPHGSIRVCTPVLPSPQLSGDSPCAGAGPAEGQTGRGGPCAGAGAAPRAAAGAGCNGHWR